jgi:hypothetical protein
VQEEREAAPLVLFGRDQAVERAVFAVRQTG